MTSWWNKKWGKDNFCGITQSRLRPGKNSYGISHTLSLKCGHNFYRKPLISWIMSCPTNNPTCPICRIQFNPQDYF